MAYSDDDIRELCLETDRIIKFDNTVTSLEELKKRLRKEVDFQDECEGGNLLGDLLLKHAAENNNSSVKDLFSKNGFKSPQQEQIAAAVNEETPDIGENKADSNEVNPSNS